MCSYFILHNKKKIQNNKNLFIFYFMEIKKYNENKGKNICFQYKIYYLIF